MTETTKCMICALDVYLEAREYQLRLIKQAEDEIQRLDREYKKHKLTCSQEQ